MRNIFVLLLMLPLLAQATTRVKPDGQPSKEYCRVRGNFLEPVVSRQLVKRNRVNHNVDSVFWKVDIREVSNPALCPPLGSRDLKIRGSSFRGTPEAPEITYRVELTEPVAGAPVKLGIEFVKGRDTFTQTDFEEWILQEQDDE